MDQRGAGRTAIKKEEHGKGGAAVNERSRRRRGAINFPRLPALRLINIICLRDHSMMWFTYSVCTLANTDALVRYARIRLRARSKRQPSALRGFYRNSRYSLPLLLRTDARSSPLFVLVERTQQRIDQPSLQHIYKFFNKK